MTGAGLQFHAKCLRSPKDKVPMQLCGMVEVWYLQFQWPARTVNIFKLSMIFEVPTVSHRLKMFLAQFTASPRSSLHDVLYL